jgi:hypothetical protein
MKTQKFLSTCLFVLFTNSLFAQIPSTSYTIAPTISGKPHFIATKLSLNTNQNINKIYIEDNTVGGDSPDSRIYADFKNLNNAGTVSQRFSIANEGFLEIGYLGTQYGTIGTPLNSIFAGFSTLQARGGSRGLILRADSPFSGSSDGIIKFLTGFSNLGGPERMRIDANGNVGIGTLNPLFKLHVENGTLQVANGNVRVQNGDVFVTDAAKGIILKSPNGNCWRVTIDDTGTFIRNTVGCPF